MKLIIGSSKGLGLSLLKSFAFKNKVISVSRRNGKKIKKNVHYLKCDINNSQHRKKLINYIGKKSLTSVYFVAGVTYKKDDIFIPIKEKQKIFDTNFFNFTNLVSDLILKNKMADDSLLCFCSSVATFFPRSKQIFYTNSKISINSYVQSLEHFIYKKKLNIRVANLMLGYLDTSMNKEKKLLLKKANTDQIAKKIMNLDHKLKNTYYMPSYWFLIKLILSFLPRKIIYLIFNKIND